MASPHPPELDSIAADSVTTSTRSDHTRFRFMCSVGGKILPRPYDNQLRYVGGETRIVAVHRSISFSALLSKLSKLSGTIDMTVKYQLPNEDLDALISVTTDEDVENMMGEYERLTHNQNPCSAKLRLFLFLKDEGPRASSICSMLGFPAKGGNWFLDALNRRAATRLEHGRSETSSVLSEARDNSDETSVPLQDRNFDVGNMNRDNVSVYDPGSPAPVISSSRCSISSPAPVLLMPNLPPVRTRVIDGHDPPVQPRDNQAQMTGFVEANYPPMILQQTGYPGETVNYTPVGYYPVHWTSQVPVYFLPGQIPPGPVQPIPQLSPHVLQYPAASLPPQMRFNHPNPGSEQVYAGNPTPMTTLDQ